MVSVPKETFQSIYAGHAPWDIGRPQPAFLAVADRITGSVLDAGCGTGDHAILFASRGCQVTGIDFVDEAITKAKKKAEGRNLSVTFLVKDALNLKGWSARFDTVIDSGLFHVFSDQDRQRYVEGLAAVLNLRGMLFLLCFSDEEPGTQGPRRISKQELHQAFANGWVIESIQPARLEVIPNLKDLTFSESGPKAWFATIRRGG
jgi:cyclopropane fatty-acyl-phospholipid synthase-like methyltransferase